jgi:adenine/guanine phosphoribosyltransferase-like PRPP-binding protein
MAQRKQARERRVIKSNQMSHEGKNGYERLRCQVAFSGRITFGLNYLLVDDFVSHGGTLANLRGHILAQKGYVIGATVLTGKDYSAELALSNAKLAELRRQHGHIEYW